MKDQRQTYLCRESEEILKNTHLGLWVIHIDPEGGASELYADSTMLQVMGVKENLTPAECFRHWYDRIDERYCYYVNCAVQSMLDTGRLIQVEYTWKHPDAGDVVVRCVGSRTENQDGKLCLEGYHRILSNLDRPKFMENDETDLMLKYRRKSDFYKALLSETVAYAELNLDTGVLLEAGGLWEAYGEENRTSGEPFFDIMSRNMEETIAPEDRDNCREQFSAEEIRRRFKNGKRTEKLNFRRMCGGELRWVRVTVHVFQEDYTDTLYALLYMKDIDLAKRREMTMEIAANLDPLTNIDNRRNFEDKVRRFMTEEQGVHEGVFLLFDLDEFKSINDRYGHQGGDMALVQMAKLLQTTFRSDDIIGRMGGDEFMVFLRNVSDRALVENRMQRLFGRMDGLQAMPFTFSAGITFASSEGFSYEECFKEADRALYNSKQKGRHRYSYYEGK